ncbi:MAG: Gfo/Idh/MocA family oxidoreductase, partial [Acidimicrobiia bacterium]
EYDNGIRAMLDLCMFAEGSKYEQEIAVTGSTGKVEAHMIPGSMVRVGDRASGEVTEMEVSDDRIRHEGHHVGSSYLETLEFTDAIRHQRPAGVTVEEGLRAVVIGVAAHRSIELGRVVEVSEVN